MKWKTRFALSVLMLLSLAGVNMFTKAGNLLQQPISITNPLAFIGEDGNVYMTDESGNATPQPVTGDSIGGAKGEFPFFERKNGYGYLRWSPVSNMLAFIQPTSKSVFVVENGKLPNKVSGLADGGFPPAFSPDGKEIAYVVQTGQAAPGDPAGTILQIQAVPATGGAPRAVGSLIGTAWQCGADTRDPADMAFFTEIGLIGYSPMTFAWLNSGFLHTMSCNGRGLALSDGQKDIWQNLDLQAAAISPDGTQLLAILTNPVSDPAGKTNQLNLVDLATGKLTPLSTTPAISRAAFSSDGKTALFSTLEAGTNTVKGNPTSVLGKQLFSGDLWPATGVENALLVWSIPATGGTPTLLFKGDGRGIGFMSPGRTKPTLVFSLVTSLADMVQGINAGDAIESVVPLAPHPELTFIPADTFGSPFKTVRGGQPLVLPVDSFSIVPAQKAVAAAPTPTLFVPAGATPTEIVPTIAAPTGINPTVTPLPSATPSIVVAVGGRCPGFLASRLVVGGKGKVLPGGSNRLRATLPNGATITNIPGDGIFDVYEGPICTSNAVAYWKVNYAGNIGYTAEGQGSTYFVEPYYPPVFAVTSVVASVSPAASNVCPTIFTFTAAITTNAAGSVTYKWERSDGASSSPQTISFAAAGTQNVTTTWNLGAAGTFWEQLRVSSPNSIVSNQATFTLSCGSPVFAVTSAVASVSPGSAGVCPSTFTFVGTITANGAGNVTYQWERSDGASSSVQTVSFAAAETKTVSTTWALGAAGTFWERLKITSPNSVTSNQATFTLVCGTPVFSVTAAAASVAPAVAGPCPKKFNFTGTITANGAGTVTYRWERSDGASGPTQTLVFAAAGTKPAAGISWNLTASGTFWERIHILTPNNRYSNQATFSQTCP